MGISQSKWIKFRQNQLNYHHEFWKQSNTQFQLEKERFIANSPSKKVSQLELSCFYREYLESSREKMFNYNCQLWKDSFLALGPEIAHEIDNFSKWVEHFSHTIKERIRLYFILWFTAGLTTPLVFAK